MNQPTFAEFVESIRALETAPAGELVLIGDVIVRVQPGESLRAAVRREIDQNPKAHAIIVGMQMEASKR